ncbi:MAG TPA: hypothetical protein VMP68_03335, partial [Candidatus Eisenbacteria bacterium]|nr:hypothetical protein [Candidatus Eisenbacteria bacterium]
GGAEASCAIARLNVGRTRSVFGAWIRGIFCVGGIPEMGMDWCGGYPPSPVDLWNHGVSGH